MHSTGIMGGGVQSGREKMFNGAKKILKIDAKKYSFDIFMLISSNLV